MLHHTYLDSVLENAFKRSMKYLFWAVEKESETSFVFFKIKKINGKKAGKKNLIQVWSDSDCVDERHKVEKQQKRARRRRPLLMFPNKYVTNNVIKMSLKRQSASCLVTQLSPLFPLPHLDQVITRHICSCKIQLTSNNTVCECLLSLVLDA